MFSRLKLTNFKAGKVTGGVALRPDEIRACGLRPDELRRQARAQEAGLQQAAAAVMQAWFERLDL